MITLLALNLCLLEAHDGSYEMNLDNYIKFNPDMKVLDDLEVTAYCKIRDAYAEIFINSLDSQSTFFEFNNHYPNNGWWGNRWPNTSWWGKGVEHNYIKDKSYSITIKGTYLNTVALKSSNHEYMWHEAPRLRRYNNGLREIDRGFFEDIIRDGYFELYVEYNYRSFYECIERIENFKDIPASEKIFKVKVLVNNPDVFKKFLRVPITSHLPVEYRSKFRALMNKLNFFN
jgi:hypothetical protein